MPRQLWLADVLHAADLTVVEVPGWKTRGYEPYDPEGIICHDTGSASRTTTDAAEIGVMVNGRPDLPPPIGQLYLSRSGTVHIVASGRGNHAKTGTAGPCKGMGNTRLLGIEAQHADGEPWTPVQYSAYVRVVAAICAHTRWTRIAGHKEHQPGQKIDPGFDMDQFRRDVAAVTRGEATMSVLVRLKDGSDGGKVWLSDGITRRWVKTPAELTAIKAAAKAGQLVVANGGNYLDVASLAPYGRDVDEVKPVEPGHLVLSADDRAAIVADLLAGLPTIEEITAAIGRQDAAGLRAAANMVDAPPA